MINARDSNLKTDTASLETHPFNMVLRDIKMNESSTASFQDNIQSYISKSFIDQNACHTTKTPHLEIAAVVQFYHPYSRLSHVLKSPGTSFHPTCDWSHPIGRPKWAAAPLDMTRCGVFLKNDAVLGRLI
jgi:hypothetical protein